MKVRENICSLMAACAIVCASPILAQQQTKTLFEVSVSAGVEEAACASEDVHQHMLQEDEEYRLRHEANELQIASYRSEESVNRSTPVTIPVVVHIIHTGEMLGTGSNISDAQVQSAIVGLNEDFRKMPGTNGDGDGVDVEMNFCLASRDPEGNPTNGIMRVDGSVVPNYATEGISIGQGSGATELSIKDLSRWSRSDYYNIWIVNEINNNDGGSGVQGFATYPASNPTRDGAVILYNAFGTEGTLKGYTNLNRTLTHEIGHAFYLYHTFTGGSCSETDCANQGDRVCDTPPTTANTSCGSPACGGTQQVSNYMDYTNQSCMNMFTQGQKDRMWANLDLFRSSLLSSQGCVAPNANDAAISQILSPDIFSCSSTFSPTVRLINYGASTLSTVDIKYRVDNGATSTYTYTGTLAPGDNIEVSLPAMTVATGSHTLYAYTESPNGQTDEFQSNDMTTKDFEVVDGNEVTVSIKIDNRGVETTWEIINAQSEVVALGGPYPSGMNNTIFDHQVCLPVGCYDFVIYDSYGDGIWGGSGFGNYTVSDSDGNELATGGDFDDIEVTQICVSASTSAPNAEFSANATSGCGASSFSFSDESTGSPTSWSWTFQGGTPSSSTQPSPSGVTYSAAGSYQVSLSVANANGSDTEVKTGYITIGAGPELSGGVTQASCHNSSDGAIDLTVSGGVTPYAYSWSQGSSSQDIMGLSGGSYTVTVTDASGCAAQASFSIQAPTAMNITISATEGGAQGGGTATATVSGGSAPYTFLWSDAGMQTTATATDLSAGEYTVIVTDSNGCQSIGSVTVGSACGVVIDDVTTTPASCTNDGTATVLVSEGVAPFSYSWSFGATSQSVDGLAAGTYDVTVTDANGCTTSATVTISGQAPLVANDYTAYAASCAEDGSATIFPTGGTSPYTFLWSDASMQTTPTATSLAAGEYTVIVTDQNGCQASQVVLIASSEGLDLSQATSGAATCTDNGWCAITPQGGAAPYSYEWSTGVSGSSQIDGLSVGSYTVTVTDANGCSASTTISVAGGTAIDLSGATTTMASCAPTGSATVSPAGGQAPYQYLWNDAAMQTTQTATGLLGGEYLVIVTDANGCEAERLVIVESSSDLDLSQCVSTPESCHADADGTATIAPQGGAGNYTYLWNDIQQQTTPTASGLTAGTYTVTVTDGAGCQSVKSITVAGPAAITTTFYVDAPRCHGTADGAVESIIQGGTAPYTANWTDTGESGLYRQGISAGSYTLAIDDANGCEANWTVFVTEPAALSSDAIVLALDTCEMSTGSVELEVTGGVGSHFVIWDDASAQVGKTLRNSPAGEYTASIRDANMCEMDKQVEIGEFCQPTSIVELTTGIAFKMYPNPLRGGQLTVTTDEVAQEAWTLRLMDARGRVIKEEHFAAGGSQLLVEVPEGILTGVYYLQLSSVSRVETKKLMIYR